MTQNTGAQKTQPQAGTVVYDEQEKLSQLRSMILQSGDAEREALLTEARRSANQWLSEQRALLDAMIASIRADADKRARETTARHLAEAEAERDKDRLRLQNELIQKALHLFQEELVRLSERPDYDAILTGVAAEACETLPKGQKLKIRLSEQDAPYGPGVVGALSARFPDLDIAFDPEPAQILGGVLLLSDEEKWRIVADWKSKVKDSSEELAKKLLAEL